MKGKTPLFALIAVIVIASGCTTDTGSQEGTGNLVLRITDQPRLDLERAEVTISDIQVHMAPGEENGTQSADWETIVEGPVTYDLLELVGVEQLLGEKELQAGIYSQIRLSVDSASVTIGGEDSELTIPSGSVKLVRAFEIIEGEDTELTLDFDAHDSIHPAGASGRYIMSPVIRVIGPSPGDGRDSDGNQTQDSGDGPLNQSS